MFCSQVYIGLALTCLSASLHISFGPETTGFYSLQKEQVSLTTEGISTALSN